MKKFFIYLTLLLILGQNNNAYAHHCGSHIYITYKDYYEEEIGFKDCDKHYAVKGVSTYYYSNGTRRNYINNTIYNKDGSILISDCRDVKHIICNNKHYFTFYKNKKYHIMDENGVITSVKNYKSMEEITPTKLLVKLDKKYGIIDIQENIIIPIKYKTFKKVGQDLYLTKLNGYYGLINSSNKIFAKNEYDKITQIYDCFLLKKENKFGLANSKGEILYNANCKKIKKLGEYIIIQVGNKKGVLDSSGNIIGDIIYKDIRLKRNNLEGLNNKIWETITDENT